MCTYNLITLVQKTTYPIILWGRWNSKGDWKQVVQLITGEHEQTRQVWEETKWACQNTALTRGERDTNIELYRTRIKPLIDSKKTQIKSKILFHLSDALISTTQAGLASQAYLDSDQRVACVFGRTQYYVMAVSSSQLETNKFWIGARRTGVYLALPNTHWSVRVMLGVSCQMQSSSSLLDRH